MKTWLLILLINGEPMGPLAKFKGLDECGKAGVTVLEAASRAYGKPNQALRFKCEATPGNRGKVGV